MYWKAAGFVFFALVVLLATYGFILMHTEQPTYRVVSSDGDFEVRKYDPFIVAEVKMQGDRKQVLAQGFKMLANYISGNNISGYKIAMTAPVIQQKDDQMHIRIIAKKLQKHSWIICFVMPSAYKLSVLPKPCNKRIVLETLPNRAFVVIRFSGRATNKRISEYEKQLLAYVAKMHFATLSTPIYAFYSQPWIPPIAKHNEIMIAIGQ